MDIAQVDIGLGDLRGEAHLRVGTIGEAARDIGARGLLAAPRAAEQVGLPRGGGAEIVELELRGAAAALPLAAERAAGNLAAQIRPVAAQRRQVGGALLAELRLRLADPRLGELDRRAVRQRVVDITVVGRGGMGVRLVRLTEGAQLVSVSVVAAEPEETSANETPTEGT